MSDAPERIWAWDETNCTDKNPHNKFTTEYIRADLAAAHIAALTAQVERLEASLRKAEQDFYEAANRFQDEDYEGPHEKFTVNVVCHIKPYFDMNMKHLRDSAAAARAIPASEKQK